MGAKANRTRVSFVEESQWGVTPTTPEMQKVNWVSETLNYDLQTATPDTVRDDRMVSDVLRLSGGNDGGWAFEMQALFSGPTDPILLGVLWAQAWSGVDSGAESMDIELGTIVLSTKLLDLTAAAQPGTLVVGQKFKITGSILGNDGIYTVASIQSPGVYVLIETPASDETFSASSTVSGQMARNGLYRHSYSFERAHLDINQYFIFTGMTPNNFQLSFEAGDKVTGTIDFIGKDSLEPADTEYGDSYVDQPLTEFMTASFNARNVMIDGLPIDACLLMGLEMNISNNVEGKLAVGNFGYCNVSEGEFDNSGNISLYFNDDTMYNKFRNGTPFSLSFELYDSEGNSYVYSFPKLKLSDDTINATGKNTDVMDDAAYVSIVDPVTLCVIQIDRFPAVTP